MKRDEKAFHSSFISPKLLNDLNANPYKHGTSAQPQLYDTASYEEQQDALFTELRNKYNHTVHLAALLLAGVNQNLQSIHSQLIKEHQARMLTEAPGLQESHLGQVRLMLVEMCAQHSGTEGVAHEFSKSEVHLWLKEDEMKHCSCCQPPSLWEQPNHQVLSRFILRWTPAVPLEATGHAQFKTDISVLLF